MAEITAASVKDLRDRSGAGMMDCKKALTETGGDTEAAIDWLRTKGLATAAKKSGRTASEGLVGVAVSGNTGAAVEVNSETDFVAKNEQFQSFVRDVTQLALTNGQSVEALAAAPMGGGSVQDQLTANIATIGENQSLRRVATVSVEQGAVVSYVHNAAAPGLGKIGVLVALEGDGDKSKVEALGKQLAMHIAAASPLALHEERLDAALVERERAIAMEKAAESGKPADIIEKMVAGAITKFRKENTLMSQLFVMDNKTKIADVIAAAAKDAGGSIALTGYVRFQLGEGIEKAESDFAAEVAAASGVKQPEPTA
ncbi:MAG: elongation factor Ts [Sphingomonadaceae bacterium]|nr:elongation factor Ts [Sphingomonadaceae bacterium]